jgi:hypothetical protein
MRARLFGDRACPARHRPLRFEIVIADGDMEPPSSASSAYLACSAGIHELQQRDAGMLAVDRADAPSIGQLRRIASTRGSSHVSIQSLVKESQI